ncbi:hypothetical protein C8J56DRAFT_1028155 [Mycena floridula]|nr:hypothetical protein C8J56DRAFT_1028155 [Mycena floridula]
MVQNPIGNTLATGIQDISAFLPVIGTEQCERHVGAALDGGFLYAAATPLSLFGSLGIVKAGVAVLCASISPKFAQMLSDAGFKLEGPAASMIGKVSRGAQEKEESAETPYLAARQFRELLKEQHIEKDRSRLAVDFSYSQWNLSLISATILLSMLSFTPYIAFVREERLSAKSVPAWAYPLLRITGSAMCVITIQLIIQIKMQQILHAVLLLKAKEESGSGPVEINSSHPKVLNTAALAHEDLEKACLSGSTQISISQRLSLVSFLPLIQTILIICISATAVGYLGCFTVVQSSSPHSTYLWLGLETALSLFRIGLWAWNPKWDEDTSVTVKIKLHDNVPLITTPQDYAFIFGHDCDSEQFMVVDEPRFLDHLAPYTGPLERFSDPDRHFALYHALIADTKAQCRVLLTMILDLETRSTYILEQRSVPVGTHSGPMLYAATFEMLDEPGIPVAKITGHDPFDKLHQFTKTVRFQSINEHCRKLFTRITGSGRIDRIQLSWTLKHTTAASLNVPELGILTDQDKGYVALGNDARSKNQKCADRASYLPSARKIAVEEMTADGGKAEATAHTGYFTRLQLSLELLAQFERTALDMSLLLETRVFAAEASADTHKDSIFTCMWNVGIAIWRRAAREQVAQRSAGDLPVARRPGPYDIDAIRDFTRFVVFDDDAVSDMSSIREHLEAAVDSTEKYLELDTWSNVMKHWPLAKEQLLDRVKEEKWAEICSLEMIEAEYALYPKLPLHRDYDKCGSTVVDIMLKRKCTVFSFDSGKYQDLIGWLPRFGNGLGVSLLQVYPEWQQGITEFMKANPEVPILSLTVVRSGPSDDVDSVILGGPPTETEELVQRNRFAWANQQSNTAGIQSFLCFENGFEPNKTSMQSSDSVGYAILLVHMAEAGSLELTLLDKLSGTGTSTKLTLSGSSYGRAPRHGQESTRIPQRRMNIKPSDEYQRRRFTFQLREGYHEIQIEYLRDLNEDCEYHLRRTITKLGRRQK